MNCEEIPNLLSARIDGELGAGEGAALDAHLATCAPCRAAAEAMEVQDAALLRAFTTRRLAAAALSERIVSEIAHGVSPARATPLSPPRSRPLWFAGVAAVAAGVVLAVLVLRPGTRPGDATPRAVPVRPVAQMTLATGEVFACPSAGQAWRPIARGEAVAPGERVRTAGTAKCEFRLSGGASVRFNGETEACFADGRNVKVASGEVCSVLPPGSPPLRLTAGRTSITARGFGDSATAPGAPPAQLDLLCAPDDATVTVLGGRAEVAGGGGAPATVRGGEIAHFPAGADASPSWACAPLADPLLATRWQDELLVLKPADDPEVAARVSQLLAKISAERSPPASTRPGPVEEDVRARGEAWSAPLASFVCSRPATAPTAPGASEQRRTAARLLADLAPPWCVPELIELLDDRDGEVRCHAATGLRRLTGQDLGYPPERCAAAPDASAAAVAWRGWWRANKARYAPPR